MGAKIERRIWFRTYDHDNQLTSAEKRATDGGTLQAKVEYAYDAFGNRLSRKEYNGSLTLIGEERFAYDGWDTAKPDATGAENFDAWADFNGSNALTTRRLYGGQFDDLVARESSAGTIAWYGTDHQGSVKQVFDNSGAVVGTISYDAFGVRTTVTGSIDRYGYTGREWDGTLGLQFNRARIYDPATARWYSADPMSFAAGDQNLYRYVGNFVTGRTDPSGYSWLSRRWDNGVNFVDGMKRQFVDQFIAPQMREIDNWYDPFLTAGGPAGPPSLQDYWDLYKEGRSWFNGSGGSGPISSGIREYQNKIEKEWEEGERHVSGH